MKKHMIAIMLSLAMAAGCISSSSVFAAETAGETPAAESPVEKTADESPAVPELTGESPAVPELTDEELTVPERTGDESSLQEELSEATEPEQPEDMQENGQNSAAPEENTDDTAAEPAGPESEELPVQEEYMGMIETDEPAQLEENREAESAGGDNVEQAIWTEGNKTLTFYYGPLFSAGDSFRGETVTNVWSGWGITHSSFLRVPAWNSTVNNTAKNVVFDTSFSEVRPQSLYGWFYGFSDLEVCDFTNLNTSNVTTMGYMFDRCSITSLDLSGFDTSNVKNMIGMFYYCTNLTDLNVSGFDTSNVASMKNMFQDCESLTSLDLSGFDTTNVEDMSYMFSGCVSLTDLDISGFDTSNVTNMSNMFNWCPSLAALDVSSFDTSNVTRMDDMFAACPSLTDLDVSGFDTSNCTTMREMFFDCANLTSLDVSGFDTSNVTSMGDMFRLCESLTGLDVSGFDTSNVTSTGRMFESCSEITYLDLSGFDMSKVTYYTDMFTDCWKLGIIYCANSVTQWNFDDSVSIFSNCFALAGIDESYEVSYLSSRNMRASMAKSAYLGGYFTPKISIFRLGKTTRGDMFNLANNVKVTWKEVPGARYYKVYREGVTDPKETRKDPVIVTTGLVGWDKDPGLTNGHAYRYKIVASLTGKGNDSGNSMQSYSKLMYRLKTVVIRSVKNTAPGKVTVKYDKTTSGDSYVLQYCERQDMVGAKTKVVLGASNTSYVIGGLKKEKTYYISIRVRKKVNGIDYYTTFGVPKKVTITK